MKKLLLRLTGLILLLLVGGTINTELMAQAESTLALYQSAMHKQPGGHEGTMVSLADLLATLEQHFEATFLFKDEVVRQKRVNTDQIQMGEYTRPPAGQVTSGAAKSLLAKVYIQQKKWGKAIDKAREVINMEVYGLLKDYAKVMDLEFSNGKEQIFSIQYSSDSDDIHLRQCFGPPSTSLSNGDA